MYRHNYDICSLNGNTLKIIAALTMLIDHTGYILFPDIILLRIIGRLSFPIFAFMISEGCAYTRNRLRYFLGIFILALICQIPYFIVEKELFWGVLFTFSLSIIAIYSLLLFKNSKKAINRILSAFLFIFVTAAIYILNCLFEIDYGFWGCMLPVFASIFKDKKHKIMMFSAGLIILSTTLGTIQPYSLLSIPLLLSYSGKRGKLNMKYFFYIFYPLHLIVLEIIKFFQTNINGL